MPLASQSVYIVSVRFRAWRSDNFAVTIEPPEQLELLMPLVDALFLPVRFRRRSTGEVCLASQQTFLAAALLE
jgi:hypothetical protein